MQRCDDNGGGGEGLVAVAVPLACLATVGVLPFLLFLGGLPPVDTALSVRNRDGWQRSQVCTLHHTMATTVSVTPCFLLSSCAAVACLADVFDGLLWQLCADTLPSKIATPRDPPPPPPPLLRVQTFLCLQLPEQILGCATVNCFDISKARNISA